MTAIMTTPVQSCPFDFEQLRTMQISAEVLDAAAAQTSGINTHMDPIELTTTGLDGDTYNMAIEDFPSGIEPLRFGDIWESILTDEYFAPYHELQVCYRAAITMTRSNSDLHYSNYYLYRITQASRLEKNAGIIIANAVNYRSRLTAQVLPEPTLITEEFCITDEPYGMLGPIAASSLARQIRSAARSR